ncbi:unnamed protein product, partial [Didymodactylos carnosus]
MNSQQVNESGQPTRFVTTNYPTTVGTPSSSSNTASPFDDNMKEETPLKGDATDGSHIPR